MANINEGKAERFKRVAARRTQNILNELRKLGNCSNSNIYKYSNEEVSKIFSAVDSEVKRVKSLFNTKAKSNKFTL